MSTATPALDLSPELYKSVPDELKILKPYLQSAYEMRKADPVIAYWCLFYAAQLAIKQKSRPQSASKFLFDLMDTVEAQKKVLENNEIIRADDLVARAYVENVALNVFNRADTEDRKGAGTKATAKGFLASSTFFDVLNVFGPLEPEQERSIKYAKWKAADYSRAFREGRKPTPGPAGGLEGETDADQTEETGVDSNDIQGLQAASDKMAGLDLIGTGQQSGLPSAQELEAEMAKLAEQETLADEDGPVAISPNVEPPTPERQNAWRDAANSSGVSPARSRRAESRLSFDSRTMLGGVDGFSNLTDRSPSSSINAANNFNFSKPMHISRQGSFASEDVPSTSPRFPETQSAFHQYTQGRIPSGGESTNGSTSPHPQRPLPHPPTPNTGRGGLPIPPGGQGNTLPLTPPSHVSPATTPPPPAQAPFASSTNEQGSSFFSSSEHPAAGLPSAPGLFAGAATIPKDKPSAPPAAPLSEEAPVDLPSSLDMQQSARVQKLAKWAISALDYEDVETARLHLREALNICEGRASGAKVSKK